MRERERETEKEIEREGGREGERGMDGDHEVYDSPHATLL